MDRSRSRLLLIEVDFDRILLGSLTAVLESADLLLAQSHFDNQSEPTKLLPQIRKVIADFDPHVLLICCKTDSLALLLDLLTAAATSVRMPIVVALNEGVGPGNLDRVLDAGASDFLLPPFEPDNVLPRLHRLFPRDAGRDSDVMAWKQRFGLDAIVGENPALIKALRLLPTIARNHEPVLIRGETGTGKELFARAIHSLSPRHEQEFQALNCAGINPELFEDELFGHVKGAFTSANSSRKGLVTQAEGGSIFLDEINSLSKRGQGALLRLLDEHHEYRRAGSTEVFHANVRVLAATNADLKALIEAGTFREDLYYRLNINGLILPPLRERIEDVPLLATELLRKLAVEFHQPTPRLSPAAKLSLRLWNWRGNLRELQSVMRSAMTQCKRSVI